MIYKNVSGIRVGFHGGAKVHWTEQVSEGTGEDRRTVERCLESGETYFDSNQYVMVIFTPNLHMKNNETQTIVWKLCVWVRSIVECVIIVGMYIFDKKGFREKT